MGVAGHQVQRGLPDAHESVSHARHSIGEYIEIFYNRQRMQARLNYQSPVALRSFYPNQIAA